MEKWIYLDNRKARCRKRARLHDDNRAKAKARRQLNKQKNTVATTNAKELDTMKRNDGIFEKTQYECMLTLIRDIFSDKSITEITYQDRHFALSVTRDTAPQTVTHAIGFAIDSNDESDDE